MKKNKNKNKNKEKRKNRKKRKKSKSKHLRKNDEYLNLFFIKIYHINNN
jgi:hypothetical protein